MTESEQPTLRRPTLQSIADLAGVSHQTVANVLNAPHKVAPQTLTRVRDVIKQLNYQPNETARSLARRSTHLVSFHVDSGQSNEASVLNPFMRELARVGATHGYRVVLDVASDDDLGQIASYEELHARRSVDGVVIPETHIGDQRPEWLIAHGVPMVAFGRPWAAPEPKHSWVDVDGGEGMRLVVEHLVNAGHRRIAYVGPPRDRGMEDDRIDGFLRSMESSVVQQDPRLQLFVGKPVELRSELPEFINTFRPTAIACRDDSFAFEVAQIVAMLGYRVGQDIAVTGFDDAELARRSRPAITSVTQPIAEVTQLIWQSLLEQFARPDSQPLQRLIKPELVVRESSSFPVRAD